MKPLLLFLISIVFLSCNIERKIYSTLPINNPALQQKNDYAVNASVSEPFGFDLNGGYALTDHFVLIGGAYFHKNKEIEERFRPNGPGDSSNLRYRHRGYTLGAGTIFPLGRKKTTILSSPE